jgi:hypothetical protein
MKTKLLGILLLAGSSLFARSQFSFSVGVGPGYGYYQPAPVVVYSPPPPVRYYAPPPAYYGGPNYTWVGGYYYPAGPNWAWRSGYWARRPYPRAVWGRSAVLRRTLVSRPLAIADTTRGLRNMVR